MSDRRKYRRDLTRRGLFGSMVEYHFNNDPVKASSLAARAISLYPIASRLRLPPDVKDVHKARAVLSSWRKLLFGLRDAGYPAFRNLTTLRAVGNCLPETVRCQFASTATCDMTICPWCHSRRASKVLSCLGFDDPDRFEKVCSGMSFVRMWRPHVKELMEEASRLNREGSVVPVLASPPEKVNALLAVRCRDARNLAGNMRDLGTGAAWHVRAWAAPLVPDGPAVLFCHPQVVTLVRKDAAVTLLDGWRIDHCPAEDREAVAGLVAEAYAYPTQWLFGSPADLVSHLKARAGLRFENAWGVFRANGAGKDVTCEDGSSPG